MQTKYNNIEILTLYAEKKKVFANTLSINSKNKDLLKKVPMFYSHVDFFNEFSTSDNRLIKLRHVCRGILLFLFFYFFRYLRHFTDTIQILLRSKV